MKHKPNYVDMADVCVLAHTLTIKDMGEKAEKVRNGTVSYTKRGQEVFDTYYDIITNTLHV